MILRPARAGDSASLARVWHDAWHDAHDGHVPAGLVAARTQQGFDDRVAQVLPRAVVADIDGVVAGFVAVRGDEVELLFVDAPHRGTGVATALLAAAEDRGGRWLSVVVGNARARRFYERQGYVDSGADEETVEVAGTSYVVVGRRYVRAARTTGPGEPTSPDR